MSSASSVPRWRKTSKASEPMSSSSSQPKIHGASSRCAEELTGMNSVSPWRRPMIAAWRTTSKRALANEERCEHEGDRGQQLHENVERRAGGVLERVADGVAHDGRRVRVGLLAEHVAGRILEVTGLDVLLRVVPRSAPVVEHGRQQDAG